MSVGAHVRILAAAAIFSLAPSIAVAAPCYTHSEARAKWPSVHLYWHTDRRCWDNRARGAEHYDERPQMKLHIMPDNVATAPASPLEQATPKAPAAEILFPSLIRGEMLQRYPLPMPVAWFDPHGMHDWPLILDIDRVPFSVWDERIGQ